MSLLPFLRAKDSNPEVQQLQRERLEAQREKVINLYLPSPLFTYTIMYVYMYMHVPCTYM